MKSDTSSTSHCDAEERDLEELLEAFGSVFSLEDIASAYCNASRNVDSAGEILCASLGSNSYSPTCTSKEKLERAESTSSELSPELEKFFFAMPSEKSSEKFLQNSPHGGGNTRFRKSKVCPVSTGTISGVIAKDYLRPRPVTNESPESIKPQKLDLKELPVSAIRSEEVPPSMAARTDKTHGDVEEFMFKLLRDGFQLDVDVVQDVLGCCGYDAQKSLEKLLELPTSSLENCGDILELGSNKSSKSEMCQGLGSACSDGAAIMVKDITESTKIDRNRFILQKEVLEALFTVPERSQEAPKRVNPMRRVNRLRASDDVVVEPLKDSAIDHKIVTAEPLAVTKEEEDEENSHEVLRKAVKEYWIAMREYYLAAVDAFVKGEFARANKLVEQGHFFNRKAREADEKSAQQLLETSPDDVVSLDLHDLEPKEALNLLRLHLTSLSGLPDFRYLRIIVGTSDEDTPKGARRRLILKQLKKESINGPRRQMVGQS